MACTLQPRLLCVCALLVLVAIITHVPTSSAEHLAYVPEDLDDETRLFALFEAWNEKHGKEYPEGHSLEKERRFTIFKQNLQYIDEHNAKAGSSGFRLGLTRFADLTNEEFKSLNIFGAAGISMRLANPGAAHPSDGELRNAGSIHACDSSSLPSALDWRAEGAVVGVKDQGQCGSCWAFSAVGAMEGAHAIATGKLISLSEQELVSCDDNNGGCQGGWMDKAFSWVVNSGGIHTEAEYPYTSSDGSEAECLTSKLSDDVVSFSAYTMVEQYSESAFLCAVAKQPVSIAITIGQDFPLYTDGVYNGDCSSSPQDIVHAVLVVGWGVSDKGGEYWIAKNSWGTLWGSEGYIYLAKGTGLPQGKCAMYYRSSYPTTSASTCGDAFE